ncbi:MAG: hypothetical protein IPM67_15190 [Sphingomonadales bacterium]|nr:hypothetical protein [Sphingomonadales bacterium]
MTISHASSCSGREIVERCKTLLRPVTVAAEDLRCTAPGQGRALSAILSREASVAIARLIAQHGVEVVAVSASERMSEVYWNRETSDKSRSRGALGRRAASKVSRTRSSSTLAVSDDPAGLVGVA